MNTITDTHMTPGHSTSSGTSSHSGKRRPVVKRLAVALAGAGLMISAGTAAANAQTDDAPARCEASGVGSADSLERTANTCELRYAECMRNAPGTADSLERWADLCYAKATD